MPDDFCREIEKRVADLENYKAAHDARITAWWEAQHKWNANREVYCDRVHGKVTNTMDGIDSRLGQVERRIVWFTGMCAGIGCLIGWVISVLAK
jgi:hypothetical protein